MDYSKRTQENQKNTLWRALGVGNIFLLVFLISYSVILSKKESDHSEEEHRPHQNLSLINPTLSKFDLVSTSDKLQIELSNYLQSKKKRGELAEYGLYFRDLDSGHGFGMNDHVKFTPASLLKLPTAIAYYKQAESNPDILQEEYSFSGNAMVMNSQVIPPKEVIEIGKKYKVHDLIARSLKYSDNLANTVLVENMDDANYVRVFQELNIILPQNADQEVMSVRDFAGVFRNLYNSNYLKLEYSQDILSLMVESDFKDGIKSGIPDYVKIANKFGERRISDQNSSLHDCGIVYSNHPYIICIMTQGKDLQTLANVISETSEMIYETMGE